MLGPISWRCPPRHYGPWEYVTSLIAEGLVAAGHDVTLYATADSITNGTLRSVCPAPLSEDPSLDPKVWESLHIANCFEHSGDADIIHNQFDFLPLTYSGLVATPVVTTIHGFSSERILPVYQRYAARSSYVAISAADRHPSLPYIATIHHGIDCSDFPLQASPSDGLIFFGRIHPDKGVREAIEVAHRTGRTLTIAGIIHDQEYFDQFVGPHVDGTNVEYVGSVGPADRNRLLGSGRALLHLVNFDEPFGLSMIEAMACGTPVIATRRGSIPEVVRDGVSGFVVDGLDQAVEAVGRCQTLDRSAVRQHVIDNFSRQRMVDAYVNVYRRIISS